MVGHFCHLRRSPFRSARFTRPKRRRSKSFWLSKAAAAKGSHTWRGLPWPRHSTHLLKIWNFHGESLVKNEKKWSMTGGFSIPLSFVKGITHLFMHIVEETRGIYLCCKPSHRLNSHGHHVYLIILHEIVKMTTKQSNRSVNLDLGDVYLLFEHA